MIVNGLAACGALMVGTILVTASHRQTPVRRPGNGSVEIGQPASLPQSSGYLYVLDAGSEAPDDSTAQVIAIDLGRGTVARTFQVGQKADFAVSPDGSRLFVSSRVWDGGAHNWKRSLETFDARSGARLATVDNPDDLTYILEGSSSRMKMSADGEWIYILKDHQTVEPPYDHYYLAVFDTSLNQFLPDTVKLAGCSRGEFFKPKQDRAIVIACSDTQAVRQIAFDRAGKPEAGVESLNWGAGITQGTRIGAGAMTTAGDRLAFVTNDGQGVALNRSTGATRRFALGPTPGRWIRMQAALVPASDQAMYYATGSEKAAKAGSDDFSQIVRADLTTLTIHARHNTMVPFGSMTLSLDGNTIYTVSPHQSTVTAVDAATLKEIGSVRPVGRFPVLAIAAPNP